MYMGGVHIKMRAHNGQNHQKTIRLVGQKTTVFGTSNWSTASDDNQLEVNYFTTKDWFYEFFRNQFEWKWNNKPLGNVVRCADGRVHSARARRTVGSHPGKRSDGSGPGQRRAEVEWEHLGAEVRHLLRHWSQPSSGGV